MAVDLVASSSNAYTRRIKYIFKALRPKYPISACWGWRRQLVESEMTDVDLTLPNQNLHVTFSKGKVCLERFTSAPLLYNSSSHTYASLTQHRAIYSITLIVNSIPEQHYDSPIYLSRSQGANPCPTYLAAGSYPAEPSCSFEDHRFQVPIHITHLGISRTPIIFTSTCLRLTIRLLPSR